MTLTRALHRSMQQAPDSVMTIFRDRTHTHREVIERVARLGGALQGLGVAAGDRVAILALNIAGVIPGLNIAGTSVIGLPIVLAAWVFVMYLGAGIRAHGLGGFLRTSLFPPGVPPYMYVLLTPIEFLTVFVIRPATLAIRLVANMISGHLMLVLVISATEFFLVEAGPSLKAYGLVTFGAALALTLFEAFIAALQAYIFVVLAAVYLNLSIQEEH